MPGCFWTDSSKRPVFTSVLTEAETGSRSVNVGCGCGFEKERGERETERCERGGTSCAADSANSEESVRVCMWPCYMFVHLLDNHAEIY